MKCKIFNVITLTRHICKSLLIFRLFLYSYHLYSRSLRDIPARLMVAFDYRVSSLQKGQCLEVSWELNVDICCKWTKALCCKLMSATQRRVGKWPDKFADKGGRKEEESLALRLLWDINMVAANTRKFNSPRSPSACRVSASFRLLFANSPSGPPSRVLIIFILFWREYAPVGAILFTRNMKNWKHENCNWCHVRSVTYADF